ncbi:MAG: hypothetical protein UX08_C0002G0010 [Candidatus Collierbacteria bacterium GW2011_GWB1_45_35]|uniref:Uncharacterized protein n=1 Tax=Candidatus Collierbacteria bacterium GW2011_GWB2_45_17 TaxID=1618388 RepID=A0A837IIP3_9BACT|nr:MAG: hypothetical protein UW48_C0004G0020 [Microgenomates group bacterium GW2011_GWC1_44_23]KKT95696.1 MAG: hypothetical protein UW96_C0005G0020 [Candidatus Collierbacteria bacterium GW2011_GWA1_45_15]KKU00343.1 MAG: hypothetical protein UX01_C0005G0020 [Candidatus Collierbacteria bacterium GW2011_GWB2_45_17]KKU05795.1 MAG: hypothetical protein UX08_C0002G0010 [Candidatus Collierbacteria bacterium GW2011_GWB1_45_35]KKU08342.1 MAG: hypothetical protein UX11_C0005G0020 [Candidatus Collierbacte
MDEKKTKFYQSYANLPLELRSEICIVIDGEPITWNIAKFELDNGTTKGLEILQKLFDLNILK